jgi:hypothetical protein
MAQERHLATARAPEATDATDATKEELQRRMEEARESITQTVSEIKETVATQYQNVRESISQTLDWREQYRRRPVAFAVGASVTGLIVGYTVGGLVMGESDLVERYYESEGEDYDRTDDGTARAGGAAIRAAAYAPAAARPAAEVAPRPSYSSGYEAQTKEEEPEKPGLLERFKETQAYDRLQHELDNIGSRVVDELSKTAQTVVLPLLLNKLKDLIGLDLTNKQSGASTGRTPSGSQATQTGGTANAPSTTGGSGSS